MDPKFRDECKSSFKERCKKPYKHRHYALTVPSVESVCVQYMDELCRAWESATFPEDVKSMDDFSQVQTFFTTFEAEGRKINRDNEHLVAGYFLEALRILTMYAQDETRRKRWRSFYPKILMSSSFGACFYLLLFLLCFRLCFNKSRRKSQKMWLKTFVCWGGAAMVSNGMRKRTQKVVREEVATKSTANLGSTSFTHSLDWASLIGGLDRIPEDYLGSGETRETVKSYLLHVVFGWTSFSAIMDRLRMFAIEGDSQRDDASSFIDDVLKPDQESSRCVVFLIFKTFLVN